MRDLERYWREIRAIQSGLAPFVWVVAQDCLIEVASSIAARLLHAKSHRLATEEEVAARKAKEAEQKKLNATEKRRREGVEVVKV